jgi:hypothetical protein
MGMIDTLFGVSNTAKAIGDATQGVAEVFVPNATQAMQARADIQRATLQAASAEFEHAGQNWFDRVINGINRLPRPVLALGTIGLFVFAMIDPAAFAQRMAGLQAIPEPLWWLLGAVVSFYFGARELHHFRATPANETQRRNRSSRRRFRLFSQSGQDQPRQAIGQDTGPNTGANSGPNIKPSNFPDNAALADWARSRE